MPNNKIIWYCVAIEIWEILRTKVIHLSEFNCILNIKSNLHKIQHYFSCMKKSKMESEITHIIKTKNALQLDQELEKFVD